MDNECVIGGEKKVTEKEQVSSGTGIRVGGERIQRIQLRQHTPLLGGIKRMTWGWWMRSRR